MEKVIIIGTGCAGWTAAIYTGRANLSPLVLAGDQLGGQLTTTTEVENYPGFPQGIMGPELMMHMQEQATKFGARVEYRKVTSVEKNGSTFNVACGEEQYEAETVIIATGADPRHLGLDGEEKLIGHGLTSCATCDGAFYRDVPVAVIGGGDSACEEATFLTKFATRVHVVHRRDELRASKVMQERAMNNEKIQFHWNSEVIEINGDEKMQQAVLKNLKTNEEKTIKVGVLFVAIGHQPNTELFKNQIDLDDEGYIVLKNKTHTNMEGVFAAGDVHDRSYRQAITAAGYGCMAAIDVDKFLTENADK